jgi:putative salt-induced outer membrane protein
MPAAIALAALLPAAAAAQQDGAAQADAEPGMMQYPVIAGSVSIGSIATSGNTDSTSTTANAETEFEYEHWRHTLALSVHRASEDDQDTADRAAASLQTDYKFSERSYLFAVGRYMKDDFGAFERRTSVAAGIGRRFIATDTVKLALEAGAGRRSQEPAGSNDRETETIGRLRGDFDWKFTADSTFSQELQIESGDSNTYSESVTAVTSRLVNAFSLRVAHTIQHNSDVPAGTESTDTITSVSLEYGF